MDEIQKGLNHHELSQSIAFERMETWAEGLDHKAHALSCKLSKMQDHFDRANKTLYWMDHKIDTIIAKMEKMDGQDEKMDHRTCAMIEMIAKMESGTNHMVRLIEKMTKMMEIWAS